MTMDFKKISIDSQSFLSELSDKPESDFDSTVINFIEKVEQRSASLPEFESCLEWINSSEPLTVNKHLKGKVCIMDFFTYCCINCMHVLPDLHALEENYSIEDGVAVVGIHSAKFENEKTSANILSAVLRYDITHPVVNDSDATLWHHMDIQCWPTFVIVSPEGKCLLYLVGEGHRNNLLKFVQVALQYYTEKGLISKHSLPIKLAKNSLASNLLQFPGKICISSSGNELIISDTGHHRILITSKDGAVKHVIGNKESGWKDGSFSETQFYAPQGVACHDGIIFVADTENHVIRKIDLSTQLVSTIAGTRKQGNDKEGGKPGLEQEISSPWDITCGPAPGNTEKAGAGAGVDVLYVAMAGSHQIWAYYLKDSTWLKKGSQKKTTCLRFAGNGNEENRNNSYPHKAAFAQPSGIILAQVKGLNMLYIADSESSSVRSVDVNTGAVKACVGAERDPMNLFAFGDKDGKGIDVKLQHPLGVTWNPKDQLIYVADSYNHKIKVVGPVKCTCETLMGNGKPGDNDGSFTDAEFNEPGGICLSKDGRHLFIADTNNHCIRIADLQEKTVKKLHIIHPDQMDYGVKLSSNKKEDIANKKTKGRLVPSNAPIKMMDPVSVNLNTPLELQVNIILPDDCDYTDEAQSRWKVTVAMEQADTVQLEPSYGVIDKEKRAITMKLSRITQDILVIEIQFELLMYICSPSGVCLMKSAILKQSVQHDENVKSTALTLEHKL